MYIGNKLGEYFSVENPALETTRRRRRRRPCLMVAVSVKGRGGAEDGEKQ